MASKLRATVPLALSIGIITFLYVEFSLNFDFHWVTDGSLGNGLDLPSNFHLAVPAAFISWGMFFALGATDKALGETAINCLIGSLAALVTFFLVSEIKQLPDFWAIALVIAVVAFALVVASGGYQWLNVPVIFTAFAACVFWWLATGADGWAKGGGGVGNSVAALGKPATAGTGAFGGVLSTPYGFVALNVFVTLMIGLVCGALSTRFAAVLTPLIAPQEGETSREATAEADERIASF